MNTENINLILNRIQPVLAHLESKLGVGIGHLWAVLVKQQYIDGFINLFWIGIGVLLLYASWRFAKFIFKYIDKKKKEVKENYEEGNYEDKDCWEDKRQDLEDRKQGWIAAIIVSVIASFLLITFNGVDMINHFANPEYQAMQEVVRMLKPPVNCK